MQNSGTALDKTESASDACSRLKISPQTLYAYVSRGWVRTLEHPSDSRKRLYFSVDIDQLRKRQTRGRSRGAIARSTIDFGEPILSSSVSSIHEGQFYYRGQNAVELSRTATLEDIFALLCNTRISVRARLRSGDVETYLSPNQSPLSRFVDALAQQVTNGRAFGNKQQAYKLLKLMANNAAREHASSSGQAIHEQLAGAWSTDPRAPDLIRRALVLSADHELNASAYAARVTASAGANLSACLLTGVLTLSGRHHAGLTDLCLAEMRRAAERPIRHYVVSENSLPSGFGHRLYPDGDPRAHEILRKCAAPQAWSRIAQKVLEQVNEHPTLDFGLAILEHQLKLPKGAGFSIFAVGRCVGWLAHCFEQRAAGKLIRPRAEARVERP